MIKFAWLIYLLTVAVVIIEMFFAWKGKTLTRKQNPVLSIPLLWHGGIVFGDLVLLPIFNGLIYPYLNMPVLFYCVSFLLAFFVTWTFHKFWWPEFEKDFQFMFPHWERSKRNKKHWYKDVSVAGWIHFNYMLIELVLIAAYVFTNVPKQVAIYSLIIFSVFIPTSQIQPELLSNRPKKIIAINTFIFYAMIFAVAYFKIY